MIILGIESSCDDTSAAVVKDGYVLSNIMASQEVHEKFGGVVPELASRAHQQNIIPVVDQALLSAKVKLNELDAIAFTRGPGLLGSLLVGTSFAKGLALALNIPLIEVNHLHAHILSHFIKNEGREDTLPVFPFLCLLVSGGHTQLVVMDNFQKINVIGKTIDDAAGEAFDKCAKVMGLTYPGGPVIDKLSKEGNEDAFRFSKPKISGFDYSFSGLKTSFLYFVRDQLKIDPDFINKNKADLAASIQKTIIEILINKLKKAVEYTGIKHIGIAGGVAANSGLRNAIEREAKMHNWKIYIPEFRFTTDNAAMVAITGYFKALNKDYAPLSTTPDARMNI